MLTAYKHDENHRLCPVAFEEMEKGSWINCAAPDAAELEKLNALTGIPVDSLQTALDREERSHVEPSANSPGCKIHGSSGATSNCSVSAPWFSAGST